MQMFFLNEIKKIYWKNREKLRGFLKRSFVDQEVACSVRGMTIHVGVSSEIEAFRAGTYATKEPETLDWIDEYIQKTDVLFDIGANIGLYSIYAAKKHPGLQVFSFEPESLNFSRLLRNILINGVKEQVMPLNIAVSGKTEISYLHLSQFQAGAALHGLGKTSNTSLKEGVYGVTLDDLCYKQGIAVPQHIKIDVDGIEDQIILQGATRLLQDKALKTILLEISEADTDSAPIHDFILKSGFTLVKSVALEANVETTNRIYSRTKIH